MNALKGILNYMKKLKSFRINYISYARVLAMFFVIFVHLCQQSEINVVRAMAQFFISGVTIFVILTGLLYGSKALKEEYPDSVTKWMKDRSKKILVPYYVIVLFILIMNFVVLNEKISFTQICMFFTCTQDFFGDFFYQIRGTGHLWYITLQVVLYLMIAFLLKYRRYINCVRRFLAVIALGQVAITLVVSPKIGRYIFYVLICLIAYFYENSGSSFLKRKISRKWGVLTVVTFITWFIRCYLWFKGCNTYIYNNLFVYYAQAILSVWFIYTLYCLEERGILIKSRIVEKLDMISYEVFLIHFMFIDGPFKIVGLFNSLILESVAIIIFSLIGGWLLYRIEKFILKVRLEEKK